VVTPDYAYLRWKTCSSRDNSLAGVPGGIVKVLSTVRRSGMAHGKSF
jgi:hypothetical protein